MPQGRLTHHPQNVIKLRLVLALAPSLAGASPAVSRGNSDRREGEFTPTWSGPLAGGMRQNPMRGLRRKLRGRRSVAVDSPYQKLLETCVEHSEKQPFAGRENQYVSFQAPGFGARNLLLGLTSMQVPLNATRFCKSTVARSANFARIRMREDSECAPG